MSLTIGFLGFGEAGSAMAQGLVSAGGDVYAYDVLAHAAQQGARIREGARLAGATLVASPADLASHAEVVFSAVTAASAVAAAASIAPDLTPRHVYVDLNSAAPAVKRDVHAVVEPTGAGFVDAALMAAVPPHGHRVPMLLAGPAAGRLAAVLGRLQMSVDVVGDEVGRAAAIKMFRSILIKGMEALLLECLMAAAEYGAEETVLASACESTPGFDWRAQADYLLCRTALHGERRAHEMRDVVATLEALGVQPFMAAAAARRIADATRVLDGRFGDREPAGYAEVVAVLREKVEA